MGERFLLVGDHLQMKPFVHPSFAFLQYTHIDVSILEFTIALKHPYVQLCRNYRSIQPVLDVVNSHLYHDRPLVASRHVEHHARAMGHLNRFEALQRCFPGGPGVSVLPVSPTLYLVGSLKLTSTR